MITARCLALSLLLPVMACATEGDDGPGPTPGACTDASSLCVTVKVPDTYAGTPKKIIVGLFESLPPLGPPTGVAAIVDNPPIGAGMPYDLEAHDVMPPGDWFVYIVLYDVAGGNFQPVADIDYVVESPDKLTIGDDPLNMPAMDLALFTGP